VVPARGRIAGDECYARVLAHLWPHAGVVNVDADDLTFANQVEQTREEARRPAMKCSGLDDQLRARPPDDLLEHKQVARVLRHRNAESRALLPRPRDVVLVKPVDEPTAQCLFERGRDRQATRPGTPVRPAQHHHQV
jgi:hypothetical protein